MKTICRTAGDATRARRQPIVVAWLLVALTAPLWSAVQVAAGGVDQDEQQVLRASLELRASYASEITTYIGMVELAKVDQVLMAPPWSITQGPALRSYDFTRDHDWVYGEQSYIDPLGLLWEQRGYEKYIRDGELATLSTHRTGNHNNGTAVYVSRDDPTRGSHWSEHITASLGLTYAADQSLAWLLDRLGPETLRHETLDGLDCVVLDYAYPEGTRPEWSSLLRLWLAVDYGYAPVMQLNLRPELNGGSTTDIAQLTRWSEFTEPAPGFWLANRSITISASEHRGRAYHDVALLALLEPQVGADALTPARRDIRQRGLMVGARVHSPEVGERSVGFDLLSMQLALQAGDLPMGFKADQVIDLIERLEQLRAVVKPPVANHGAN